MQIYFSPEVVTLEFQVLNVVSDNEEVMGNVAFLFDEDKLYVYGILEEEGVAADFKDLVTPYVKGLAKAKKDVEVYACLYIGGKKLTLNDDDEE